MLPHAHARMTLVVRFKTSEVDAMVFGRARTRDSCLHMHLFIR